MTHKKILHTAQLTNNCPECYAKNGLELTFAQEETETAFYKKAEKEISETLVCHTCNTTIYPVNWTDDIERVYQYNRKLAVPKKSGIQLKLMSYGLILVLIALMIILYILLKN